MGLVNYEQKGAIGYVTINRPEALNALNTNVINELRKTFEDIDQDTVRCIILTGAGDKSFVAGADITEMVNLTAQEGEKFGKNGNDCFRMIENFPIPVIAKVQGYALGGGCELSMACDIRIASEKAVFGQPETGLGVTPGFGGTQRLPRIVGAAVAKQLLYTAKNIHADEAYRIGLVNAVYPADQLDEEVEKLAQRIAKNAPIAVRACKTCVNEGLEVPMDKAITIEEKIFGSTFATEDQSEGMGAFVEKRKEKTFKNK
ncbi:MAG: enoyl-CoA hydratase-related protein [Anaerovoracaceae bacterium]